MLNLTSYERMRRYLAADDPTNTSFSALTDTVYLEREITNWITSISRQMQRWCGRDFEIAAYTEYADIKYNKTKYWINNYPITTLTDVYEDSTGEYSGDESEISSDDVYIGSDNRSMVIAYPLSHLTPKGLRIRYTGGLAYDGVKSTFAITAASAFTAGKYVVGSVSGALGIVRGTPSTTGVIVENLFGIFESDETLTEYSDETQQTATAKTATLDTITYQSLAESYPDIVMACEMEVRFRFKHKGDFELISSSKDNSNSRRNDVSPKPFTPEVMALLSQHKNRLPEQNG